VIAWALATNSVSTGVALDPSASAERPLTEDWSRFVQSNRGCRLSGDCFILSAWSLVSEMDGNDSLFIHRTLMRFQLHLGRAG